MKQIKINKYTKYLHSTINELVLMETTGEHPLFANTHGTFTKIGRYKTIKQS